MMHPQLTLALRPSRLRGEGIEGSVANSGGGRKRDRGSLASPRPMPYDPRAMNFDFSADQKSLREQARKFLGEHASSARVRRILEGAAPYDVDKGEPFAFAADGWLGQQLVVSPSLGLVVVRQHEAPDGVKADDGYNQRVGYFKLARDIELALLPVSASTAARAAPDR